MIHYRDFDKIIDNAMEKLGNLKDKLTSRTHTIDVLNNDYHSPSHQK